MDSLATKGLDAINSCSQPVENKTTTQSIKMESLYNKLQREMHDKFG